MTGDFGWTHGRVNRSGDEKGNNDDNMDIDHAGPAACRVRA